jgi:hypothetical protein
MWLFIIILNGVILFTQQIYSKNFEDLPMYKRPPEKIKEIYYPSLSLEEIKNISQQFSILSPEEVVKTYCDLDAKGARGSGRSKEEDLMAYKITLLVNWVEEPGWDQTWIIDGYEIYNKNIKRDRATISVVYRVIGIYCGNKFHPFCFYQLINFKLVKTEKGWKITDPLIPPHELKTTFIKYLTKEISLTTDKKWKKELQVLIDRIKDERFWEH